MWFQFKDIHSDDDKETYIYIDAKTQEEATIRFENEIKHNPYGHVNVAVQTIQTINMPRQNK